MEAGLRIFYRILALTAVVAVCAIAYVAIAMHMDSPPSSGTSPVDFSIVLTVLLTTVTVIFTVCAIVLAVLGFFGFRNLKREAGRFAEAQALAKIEQAFSAQGTAIAHIEEIMKKEDGAHRRFVERTVRAEVISLLPLLAEKFSSGPSGMASSEPEDEGHVD